jgi:hypothetical protein
MGQMAKALGAGPSSESRGMRRKLKRALQFGADFVINSTGKDAGAVSKDFEASARKRGFRAQGGRSSRSPAQTGTGNRPGLLSFTGKLIVVGFSMAKTEYAIGRLMAFDAEIIGTWGCLPEYYPVVLDMVLRGKSTSGSLWKPTHEFDCRDLCRGAQDAPYERIVLTPDFSMKKDARKVLLRTDIKQRKGGNDYGFKRFGMDAERRRNQRSRAAHGVHWGTEAPCTVYEKRPLKDPKTGKVVGSFCLLDSVEQPQAVQLLHHGDGEGRHRRV